MRGLHVIHLERSPRGDHQAVLIVGKADQVPNHRCIMATASWVTAQPTRAQCGEGMPLRAVRKHENIIAGHDCRCTELRGKSA